MNNMDSLVILLVGGILITLVVLVSSVTEVDDKITALSDKLLYMGKVNETVLGVW